MKTIEGREAVLSNCAGMLCDESRFSLGVPAAVYYPENTDDVRAVMRIAQASQTPLTIMGGRTGITAGCVPDEGCLAIAFTSMQRILRVDLRPGMPPVLVCQPGVTLESIDRFLLDPLSWPYGVAGAHQLKPGAWFYPPDPTETSAQLGGTVATNASGARSFRFGATRRHIHSLGIALAGGDTLSIERGRVFFKDGACRFSSDQGTAFNLPAMRFTPIGLKNAAGFFHAAGMDLIDLFIGSEGTLGIFTEIGIKLTPRRPCIAGLSFFDSRAAAFAFADFLRLRSDIAAIEFFDDTALRLIEEGSDGISLKIPTLPSGARSAVYWESCENSGKRFDDELDAWEETLASCGSSFDMTWSGFDEAERRRLKSFRHAVPELVNKKIALYQRTAPSIRKVSTDAAVPPQAFQAFFDTTLSRIEKTGVDCVIFGHLGDYHLHFNMLPRDDAQMKQALEMYSRIMDDAVASGGTVSAEHGIGKLKIPYFERMYGAGAVAQMRAIKKSLDPQWLLNRGTLFAYPQSDILE